MKPNFVVVFLTGILLVTMVLGCQNDSIVSVQDNPASQGPKFIKLPKNPSRSPFARLVADTAQS